MALLDIFKKKGQKGGGKRRPRVEKKETPKPKKVLKPETKIGPDPAFVAKKKSPELASNILYTPHITEKATSLAENNKYVFKVWPRTNKTEIKKAVEGLYGVQVTKVKIINVAGKEIKRGKQTGVSKGYKKAIVGVKEGQKIEILPR